VNISLRPATHADLERTLAWANDADTRAASFRSAPIARSDHDAWFRRSLHGTERTLLIAQLDDTPIGIVRLDHIAGGQGPDIPGVRAEIGITLAPEWRARALAAPLLAAAIQNARQLGIQRLLARIRPTNQRSIRCFIRAGFQLTGSENVAGQPALRYQLTLPPKP
jgi:RimJ/RimL family protein N-acetyltransferase